MKPKPSRKIINPILILTVSILLLICVTPQTSAQRLRSTVRRIQTEQRRRNSQVIEQAKRWQREHEQRLLEWKRYRGAEKKALSLNP